MWDLYGLEREAQDRSREIESEAAEMGLAAQARRGKRHGRRKERRRRNAERRPGGPLHTFAIVWYAVAAALFRTGAKATKATKGAGKRGFHGGVVEKGE